MWLGCPKAGIRLRAEKGKEVSAGGIRLYAVSRGW